MKVRLWDVETGTLVGVVEQDGPIQIIWFAPSFTTLMDEAPNEPGHYAIAIQPTLAKGPYLITHAYLGIANLGGGHQEASEPS